MSQRCLVLGALAVALFATPGVAQPKWIEARGPHVTVVTDAGAGRARDIAWQFEQVREAIAVTFPWIRANLSRPLMVVAARDLTTMRALAPSLFEKPDGHRYVTSSAGGPDRAYVALRADIRIDDREGINPYQSAYFAFASQALGETHARFPLWLHRGLAEVISNTLVRDKEIQIGRMLPSNLVALRSGGRMPLRDVVAMGTEDPRLDRSDVLGSFDATAWAFVHFLVFAENGAHQKDLLAYINTLMRGAEPTTTFPSTIGDIARLESPFNVYINRDIHPFAKVAESARLSREGFSVRDVPLAEALAVRASLHVAMGRPREARAAIAESRALDPGAGADEADALLADSEDRHDDARTQLEKAVTQKRASWYVPYRLATLTSRDDRMLPNVEQWLQQATALNPNADDAWAYLGQVMAALERGEASLAPVEKAIALMPASSGHRVAQARVLRRLNRRGDAMQAAGIARALAKTEPERAAAQGVLAELAKAELEAQAVTDVPATAPTTPSSASAGASSGGRTAPSPPSTPTATAGSSVDLAALAGATSTADAAEVGLLLASCMSEPAACRKALPAVAGACNAGGAPTSGAACRNAGYILDVGLGVPQSAMGAADFYRKGCARKDTLSCVRLATLQALGRGVTKDVPAALEVLEEACTDDVQEACFRLGVHLSSTKVPADTTRARDLLSTSCAAGFEESCAWLKKLPPG